LKSFVNFIVFLPRTTFFRPETAPPFWLNFYVDITYLFIWRYSGLFLWNTVVMGDNNCALLRVKSIPLDALGLAGSSFPPSRKRTINKIYAD
jgi:hypothetical protein